MPRAIQFIFFIIAICCLECCSKQSDNNEQIIKTAYFGGIELEIAAHPSNHSEIISNNNHIFNEVDTFRLASPVQQVVFQNIGSYNYWSSLDLSHTNDSSKEFQGLEYLMINLTGSKPLSFEESKQTSARLLDFFLAHGFDVQYFIDHRSERLIYDNIKNKKIQFEEQYALGVLSWGACSDLYCAYYNHNLPTVKWYSLRNKKDSVCFPGYLESFCYSFPSRDRLSIIRRSEHRKAG